MQRRVVSCNVHYLYIIVNIIMNGTIVLGGGRGTIGQVRYSMANEVEWGEVQRHRVLVSALFGQFVGIDIIENILIVCLNFDMPLL